jgi:hypothetical protein
MYERYTKIAPILPFVADDRMRYRLICSVSEKSGVSKQTTVPFHKGIRFGGPLFFDLLLQHCDLRL